MLYPKLDLLTQYGELKFSTKFGGHNYEDMHQKLIGNNLGWSMSCLPGTTLAASPGICSKCCVRSLKI